MDDISRLGYLSIATRFRRISEKLYLDGDKIYDLHDISFKASWFSVYYVLSIANAPMTVTEITEKIDFTHITVKNVLKDLVKEGLVSVEINPNDKRSKLVSLTDKGDLLRKDLEPVWLKFSDALQETFTAGHPDIINILDRIDKETHERPIDQRVTEGPSNAVRIADYRPSLKDAFSQLVKPWLSDLLDGVLEEEDEQTLENPELYVINGGFIFYATYGAKLVGVVALKRLDDERLEFAKLYVHPEYRGLGIASKLIERCVGRSLENAATELWLQSTLSAVKAHRLYAKMGFEDSEPPASMNVLKRTEKTMVLRLNSIIN